MTLRVERALHDLAGRIEQRPGWWLFPSEAVVRGFAGTGPVFLVGDQPSTSNWPESDPNRRVLYDTLEAVGLANAHITDLYKRRGPASALRSGTIPEDFSEHLAIFREEVQILRPTRIIAMGALAQELVWRHLPELRSLIRGVWHFAYVNRCAKNLRVERGRTYAEQLRNAIRDV